MARLSLCEVGLMLAIPLCDALVPPSFAPRAVTWAPVGHPSPMHMRSTAEALTSSSQIPSSPVALETDELPPLPSIDDREELRRTHGFSDEANWLVPGRVLVGRYPGSDPFLPCSPEEQQACLRDLVQRGGVGVFVCLQDELPSQLDEESWGAEKEIARPGHHGFHWYAGDAALAGQEVGRQVKCVHFPASESGGVIQPLSRLHLLIQGLKHRVLTKREVLYLHCWGGCGRTGVVAACLLASLYPPPHFASAHDVVAHVNSYFHLRSEAALLPHKRSPESQAQIDEVHEYFRVYIEGRQHAHKP